MVTSAVICAIALDEELYLKEWVDYHIGMGFAHIYIYDNSEDNVLVNFGSPNVTIIPYAGQVQQLNAYNSFITHYGHQDTWCAFLDIDEFVVLRKHDHINDFLNEYLPHSANAGALGLNWYMFGDSGKKEYEPNPVVQRFLYRHAEVNLHIKTIVRMDSATSVHNPHFIHLKEGKYIIDTLGRTIDGPFNPSGPTDIACIHHYFWKSEAEFRKKIERGRADVHSKRSMDEYEEARRNEVFDASAWELYVKNCL